MPVVSSHSAFVDTVLDLAGTASNVTNATLDSIPAVCAFPVSGQYGPGTRFLYYVLVAACVFGRGSEWLRGVCLAAALLLPAVAALHGIVLAGVHVDGVVDMDVYGALQICAIGVLAGPSTVKLSRTYFETPGRNIIFAWSMLVLAGLLSLAVEFYRANAINCPIADFAYGENACNLTCSTDDGPFSPLRGGSQNNIYVIEAPAILSFGTCTLLAAACCIPAVLSLVSTWNKILKLNWTERFGDKKETDANELARNPSALQAAKMGNINDNIRYLLSMVEIPIFSAAIIVIVVFGERNFFSYQVAYMGEPIASVGQWAPIAGTGLAVLGSLSAILAAGDEKQVDDGRNPRTAPHECCTCSHPHTTNQINPLKTPSIRQSSEETSIELEHREATHEITLDVPPLSPPPAAALGRNRQRGRTMTLNQPPARPETDLGRSITAPAAPPSSDTTNPTEIKDFASRRKVSYMFRRVGSFLGTPDPGEFDDSAFQEGAAADWPTVPGEEQRNADLPRIVENYNLPREPGGQLTPSGIPKRQRSRTGSFHSRRASGLGIDGVEETIASSPGAMSPEMGVAVAGPSQPTPTQVKSFLSVPEHGPRPSLD